MEEKKISVKVPASTANLGPGFDSIGMAFQLYTHITVSRAETTTIRMYGSELEGIPTDKSNLIYRVMQKVFATVGEAMPELDISVESNIPLTRGLGSSASAIIGGLTAANRLLKRPLPVERIYQIGTEWEGHPDNVGASLFGGIVIATMEEGKTPYIRLTPPEGLKAVAVIPDFPLLTDQARNVLPQKYGRKDVVHAISHASLLAAALATGDVEKLRYAMQDRIHQPYRAPLVPGMERLLEEATEHGALGVALSGAGPTMIALTCGEEAALTAFMKKTMEACEVPAEVTLLHPDLKGVQVEGTFVDIVSNP